jgi:hypothetical protein
MTPKQEKFAQCIADGMNQADAYRAAYDASNMKDSSIYVNASKLLSDTKVAQRVQELKEQLSSKALWTRADSVRALETAMRIAQDKDNAAGLVAAVKELNAMHGFNEPSKLELTGGTNNVNRVEFLLVNT